MKRKCAILALTAILILGLLAGTAMAQKPVVKALFFYSPSCSHCQKVITEFLPTLVAKYGDQLEIAFIDISNAQNYQGLLQLEAAYGVKAAQGAVPEVFIGQDVLLGDIQIPAKMGCTLACDSM